MCTRALPIGFTLALLALVIARAFPAAAAQDGAYVAQLEAWRKQHEEDYRRDYVPLAGLFRLGLGSNTIGSEAYSNVRLPGRAPAKVGVILYQRDGRLFFQPNWPGIAMLNGKPVGGPIPLKSDANETQVPDQLTIPPLGAGAAASGSKVPVTIWVHDTGAQRMVRLSDPEGEPARAFKGFQWFAIDRQFRVVGKFIKDPAPRKLMVPNLLGDEDEYATEGVVEFTLAGKTARLRPFTSKPNRFFIVFKDETSGRETYEAARFLYADLESDGTVVLDFNQAYNPPCAFNPFTTCPVPLPENKLGLRILAGEKAYPDPPKL